MTAIESLATLAKERYGAQIAYKNTSTFMKFIGAIVGLFNKDFMTTYITTIGKIVYFPSEEWVNKNPNVAAQVFAHELVHINDYEKHPYIYNFMYLFPLPLAVLSLFSFLAFVNTWWFLCLLFLVFLAPIPAPGRFYYEARGYSMTMFYMSLELGKSFMAVQCAKSLSDYFVGPFYYYMWPFRDNVNQKLMDNYFALPNKNEVFTAVNSWFNSYFGRDP